jgi:predicted ATP-grasp superfamily ATP-dependent carboligase
MNTAFNTISATTNTTNTNVDSESGLRLKVEKLEEELQDLKETHQREIMIMQ